MRACAWSTAERRNGGHRGDRRLAPARAAVSSLGWPGPSRPFAPAGRPAVSDDAPAAGRPAPSPRQASARPWSGTSSTPWSRRTPTRSGARSTSSTSAVAPGGFAVPLAGLGHRVTVVDPSPDALAALQRRAAEAGVAERVHAEQGDAGALSAVVGPAAADVLLCHGVLEHVDDPKGAVLDMLEVLRPDGLVSVLVAQRLGALLARALSGRFAAARRCSTTPRAATGPGDPVPRRFDRAGLLALFDEPPVHVRAAARGAARHRPAPRGARRRRRRGGGRACWNSSGPPANIPSSRRSPRSCMSSCSAGPGARAPG